MGAKLSTILYGIERSIALSLRLTALYLLDMNFFLAYTHFSYTLDKATESNNQTKLFPSLLLYYNTTNYYTTVGLYSYNLRPNYTWMIGKTRRVNDYISATGNPDLKPQNAYGLICYNTLFQYAKLNLGYYIYKNRIQNVYSAVDDGLYGEVLNSVHKNAGDLYQFRTNLVLTFALYDRVLTGQIQANMRYSKLKDLKSDFAIPTGRKSEYINHYYATNINVMPSKRLNIMISGNFTPRQRHILAVASGIQLHIYMTI